VVSDLTPFLFTRVAAARFETIAASIYLVQSSVCALSADRKGLFRLNSNSMVSPITARFQRECRYYVLRLPLSSASQFKGARCCMLQQRWQPLEQVCVDVMGRRSASPAVMPAASV